MTRNEAIKCLELEDGFTSEDVKHSYARLTKTVRPEEKPEEFSKLNEAYRLLSAELRRRGRNANVSDRHVEGKSSNKIEKTPAGNLKENDATIESDASKGTDVSIETNISKVTDISKTEVISKTVESSTLEVVSKAVESSSPEVVSKAVESSSPEVVSKAVESSSPEVVSKTVEASSSEVSTRIEDASSKDITNIKANPEWEKQFVNMFAKEDIDRKRLAAIEEELVNVLRLQLLERKTGLKQFFGYGNSSVLKSLEFKAFFAERLINIWLDPEETNLIINYYRLKKSSNSTEDILLLARLNKNKKKLTLTKIAEMFVISFIIAASATMLIHGGLPKEPSAYVIGVITMLIIFFMLLKTRFPI